MCVLWSTTIRGSTHKFKSTTHLTATTKHPSMSTHINTQPTAMYNHLEHHIRRMHVIRPRRKTSNRTIPHILKTHTHYIAMISATVQPHPLSHLCGFVCFPSLTFNQLSCITPLSRKLLFMHPRKGYSSQLQYQATSLHVLDLPPGISYKSCMQAAGMHS